MGVSGVFLEYIMMTSWLISIIDLWLCDKRIQKRSLGVSHKALEEMVISAIIILTFCRNLSYHWPPAKFQLLTSDLTLLCTMFQNSQSYWSERQAFAGRFLKCVWPFWNRSSHIEVFCKKVILNNFVKFTGKHLCQIHFFHKVSLLKKRL